MHFVTGGAYNGKAKWVRDFYHFEGTYQWHSAYKGDVLPEKLSPQNANIVVFEGIEYWLKQRINNLELDQIRKEWKRFINEWKTIDDSTHNATIILIGTDITKGIVPLNETDRKWRDLTGWVYQDIVRNANRVDTIWYGLNQRLK
ncbi:bifunctional adenosylcobinamide kinase/adenosylcobinamide-phosphate guanylyltransferase [Rossellomorea sp. BNER]|uniref:bifunctional adenosylcobinamide kinase/adenosylcobinamide-phosphate guanylyltransferase n=1 Tax=Rossellomorea sp. BNER TaxID=2962031 RepID=UPI003AF29BF6|nr:bifunctional adenosylcobinamide kinase/adenosylcobinamide-phosphate guanylyltransferase [Rossellomorea sp. BNER]